MGRVPERDITIHGLFALGVHRGVAWFGSCSCHKLLPCIIDDDMIGEIVKVQVGLCTATQEKGGGGRKGGRPKCEQEE